MSFCATDDPKARGEVPFWSVLLAVSDIVLWAPLYVPGPGCGCAFGSKEYLLAMPIMCTCWLFFNFSAKSTVEY